jgi:type I restriction enzyme, R subunit
MSASQFLQELFGILPDFFKDETELRRIWSDPETRKALLEGLAEKGFGREAMLEMQRVIEAQNSDIFDVLAYVAYAYAPLTREERANRAKVAIADHFDDAQRAFIDFVLAQYIRMGVDELGSEKLPPLLELKYGGVKDGIAVLGAPEHVRQLFAGFQQYLYEPAG